MKILELELEWFEVTFEGLMNEHDELVRDLQLGNGEELLVERESAPSRKVFGYLPWK